MPPAIDLARRYTQALAALRAIHDFDAWLGDYWREQCPAPATAPAARTPLGAAGAITWHEERDRVVGYLPGADGCFDLPRDMPLPAFSLTGEISPPYDDRDILIHASMREELQPPDR
jgi:hypothetical protein